MADHAQSVDTGVDGLPPLPAPDVRQAAAPVKHPTAWSESLVRQAQREAVAADRQARQPVLDEQASVMLTQRKKIQKLEAVVRAEVDDMMRIYEALGLSDSDVLDAEVVIQRIANLRAELASRGAEQERNTSIDTPEFEDLAARVCKGEAKLCHLIAHIDAWADQARKQAALQELADLGQEIEQQIKGDG